MTDRQEFCQWLTGHFAADVLHCRVLALRQIAVDAVRHVDVIELVGLHVGRESGHVAVVETQRAQVVGSEQLETVRQWEQACNTLEWTQL